jgi:hypothetical protein
MGQKPNFVSPIKISSKNLGLSGSIDQTSRSMPKEKIWDLVHNLGFCGINSQGYSFSHNQSSSLVGKLGDKVIASKLSNQSNFFHVGCQIRAGNI